MSDSDSEYSEDNYEPSEQWIYRINSNRYSELYIEKDGKKICNRKIEKPNRKYRYCKGELFICDWCHNHLCPSLQCIPQYMLRSCSQIYPSKKHDHCTYCKLVITCNPSGVCKTCEVNHRYDMITEDIAIGSYQASYEPFDLIINLDYPQNHVKQNEVHYSIENNKHIIRCGYNDMEINGLTTKKIDDLLNRIEEIKKEKKDPKILFHCYAGISRSSTVAIAYLSRLVNKTTKEVYNMVKEKRPRIEHNPFFKQLLGLDEVHT